MRLIAEVGQAHEGSLGQAHAFIDAIAKNGLKEIKFQTHIADSESSKLEPFRVNFSYQDKTRKEYWKRMEFSEGQWLELKKHCELKKVSFLSTATCIASAELLIRIGCKKVKIGSGDFNNNLLIDFCSDHFDEIIFSTGLCNRSEIKKMIKRVNNSNYASKSWFFSCNTKYPTPLNETNIANMDYIKNFFNGPIGHSDHSANKNTLLAATLMGAKALEFHVAWDKLQFGPDSSSSFALREIPEIIKDIKDIKKIKSSLNKNFGSNSEKDNNKAIFGKSLTAKVNIPLNKPISLSDLESTKPSKQGIDASDYQLIIGKCVKKKIFKGEFIKPNDILY